MYNLYGVLRSAHGGQALENLASQYNLMPEQADAAVKAVVQELSGGLLNRASEPVAFGSFLGKLTQVHYRQAFADPAAAQASAQTSGAHLSEILGSTGAKEEIIRKASSATGISQEILSQMLPVIVSMIFGGLTKSLENQGFGSLLGQLSNAASRGTLGPALGHILAGSPPPANPEPQPAQGAGPLAGAGILGALLGTVLGTLRQLTGGQEAQPTSPGASPAPSPNIDAAALQAALAALKKLLQPGTPPPPPPQAETPPPPAPPLQEETPAAPPPRTEASPASPREEPLPPEEQETDISAELDRIIGKNPD